MKLFYNPGCALLLYKEELANKVYAFLKQENDINWHTICCHHHPQLENGSTIINTCTGCNKRFETLYDEIDTYSIWEYLATSTSFDFPDHSDLILTIHDACPARNKPEIHNAIRTILKKMNIQIIEASASREKSVCCGDSLYPHKNKDNILLAMRKRAASLPSNNVCVYCISCIKSIHNGGKKPFYLLDLLFNEETEIQEYDTKKWHDILQVFIENH